MPNTATRLITLIMLLQRQPNQKAAELAEKLGLAYVIKDTPFPQLDQPRHQRLLQLRQDSYSAPQPEELWKDLLSEVGAYGAERELVLLAEVMLISGKAVAVIKR